MNISESSEAPFSGTFDYRAELLRRIRHASQVFKSEQAKSYELEMCRRDVVHFINNWGWTFDPRVVPANLPFRLFPYQIELLQWIEEGFQKREHGLVEKSRDMGASWVFIAWFYHSLKFRPGFFGKIGSRKQELVDDFTEDSLFGKLRYFYYRLPQFLRIKDLIPRVHDNHLRFQNPKNGNKIVGESANQDFGRGGRSSFALLDEGASIPHSESVWSSVSQNSNCVVWLSNPKGRNNAFARLRHKSKIRVKTLHWSQDPRKNQKWYEEQKEILLPWEIGQELDLSYDVETGDKIYQRFQRQWHVAKEVIKFNPDFEQWRAWDFGGTSPTAILWIQITPDDTVQIYQTFELGGWDIDFFRPIAWGETPPELRLLPKADQELIKQTIRKVPKKGEVYSFRDAGDNAGTARTANSKRSCKDALAEVGINLQTSGKQTYDWRFKCTDRLFRLRPVDPQKNVWKPRIQISPDCTRFIECLNSYVHNPTALAKGLVEPIINWASHQVTALEFFAINRYPIETNVPYYQEQTFR